MKKLFLLPFIGAALLGFSWAKAAPAPWGLAINTETKECAGFWPGDEFVAYKLPEGWKAYYPTRDQLNGPWSTVETDAGECSFQIRKEEACCLELGYKYVSDNIGKDQRTVLRDREEFEKKLAEQRRGSHSQSHAAIAILLFAIAGFIALIKYLKKRKQ